MKRILLAALVLGLSLSTYSCREVSSEEYNQQAADPMLLHSTSRHLTDVIVYDIFKPPVASRIYAYSFLAAYEALQTQSDEHISLAGKLNDFTAVPEPQKDQEYCFPLASMKAFTTVGEALTFSGDLWEAYEKDFFQQYKEMGIPGDVYDRSIAYGEQVAQHILEYAGKDNYNTTRGFRHTLKHVPGCWEPTPPTYAEACEPQWSRIRTFTLDSAAQFAPPPPAAYDLNQNSDFYKLTMEVYTYGKNMTEEEKEIAYFWDDNPFVTNLVGHATFTEKKMTPPGHWIEITRTVAQDQQLSMIQSLEAYTLSSIALFDAFVSCWETKYKTDRVRPVTVINNNIDQDWMPFLETPAFPEYISGHSAISAAAGKVLIHLLGNQVSFTDSTEYKYGHGVRSFTSFEQAYWETSVSRLYGGIHFRDGIEQGTYHGEKVGDWVWLKTKEASAEILAEETAEEPHAENRALKATIKQ